MRLIRYGHIRFRNFLSKVLETYWQRGLKTVRLSIADKGWNGHRQQVSPLHPQICKGSDVLRFSLGIEVPGFSGSAYSSEYH